MLKARMIRRICGLCLAILATAAATQSVSAKGPRRLAGKAQFLHRAVGAFFRKPYDLAVDPTQGNVFKVYGWRAALRRLSSGRGGLWERANGEVIHDLALVRQRSLARDQAEKCHNTCMISLPQLLGKRAPSMTRRQLRKAFMQRRGEDYTEGYRKTRKSPRYTYPKDMVNAAAVLGLEAEVLKPSDLEGACEAFLKQQGHDAFVVTTPRHWTVVARHPEHGLVYFDPMQAPIKIDAAQARELMKRAELGHRSIGVRSRRNSPQLGQ
jgi:hypothetical protein